MPHINGNERDTIGHLPIAYTWLNIISDNQNRQFTLFGASPVPSDSVWDIELDRDDYMFMNG